MALPECFAEEDLPLPEGVFHLVAADADLTDRAWRPKVTLCGASLGCSDLPPPCFGEEGTEIDFDDNPRFCLRCAREAVRWSTGTRALADSRSGVPGE